MNVIIDNTKLTEFKFPLTEILLLIVAICWGTSYGLTKDALTYTSVYLFIALRFSITFLCLLPVVIRDFALGRNKDWRYAMPTGLVLSAIFICEVNGVANTTASKAAVLISLFVIFTALAELIINKVMINKALMILSATSVLGVFLLTSSATFEVSLNQGDWLILTAALLRTIMVTVTKKQTQKREITTATLTAIQALTVASVAITLLLFTLSTDLTLPLNTSFWFIITYLVLFCTLFAFFVQNYAVRTISPTKASLLMGSEPLFGAMFAILWLGEDFTILQLIGGILILVSVIFASLQNN
jgi:drug/metabolite transporter (DMT)-like permease